MSKFIDMTDWVMSQHGVVDSRWTVMARDKDMVQENGKHFIMWKCICQCGNIKTVYGSNLRSGKSKSCGCLSKEVAKTRDYKNVNRPVKHGGAKTRLYYEWTHIKARCYNQNTSNYDDYGGRGIIMCDDWNNSFESFRDWAIANGYNDNLTIDRIDVDGNYEPSNCRWATQKEQSNNRRNNIIVEINGEKKALKQWCEIYNKNYQRAHYRMRKLHWDATDAIFLPICKAGTINKIGKRVMCDGIIFESIVSCAKNIERNSKSVAMWLNHTRKMPQEFIDRGLKFVD